MSLKTQINDTLKAAMREKQMTVVTALRGLGAAIKQIEVDSRIELDDSAVVAVIEKQIKQRKESIAAFTSANRSDLAGQEQFELEILSQFLPEQLSNEQLTVLIDKAIIQAEASSMRDMGKVMAIVRPQIAGVADASDVSNRIKQKLNSLSS